MKKAVFTGAEVALVTPFHKDGSINYGKLEELIDYQIENSTDAIVVCATTGESPTLSRSRRSAYGHAVLQQDIAGRTDRAFQFHCGQGQHTDNPLQCAKPHGAEHKTRDLL